MTLETTAPKNVWQFITPDRVSKIVAFVRLRPISMPLSDQPARGFPFTHLRNQSAENGRFGDSDVLCLRCPTTRFDRASAFSSTAAEF